MTGLTRRQQEVADYIHTFIIDHHYSPSYREIGLHFGFQSLGTVYKHVRILKRKGILTNEPKKRRSLALASDRHQPQTKPWEIQLPFIGHIKGGEPISTFPESQTLSVPSSMVSSPESTYVFRVMGDNLIDEHIVDGDLLIVEARQEVQPGETIVGLIHKDELLIRRFYPEGQYIRLHSHSTLQSPIIVKQAELIVQGVLVGLIRIYG